MVNSSPWQSAFQSCHQRFPCFIVNVAARGRAALDVEEPRALVEQAMKGE